MDLKVRKNEIKREIDKIEDEKLLWAIARLLHLDDEGENMNKVEKYEQTKSEKKYRTQEAILKEHLWYSLTTVTINFALISLNTGINK